MGATVGASIYIYIYIYISPNYFGGWVERSKTPWGALPFCGGSRAKWRFSVRNRRTGREICALRVKRVVFYRQLWGPGRAGPEAATLSRIPAPTPPDPKRQGHLFFGAAPFARGGAAFFLRRAVIYVTFVRQFSSSGNPVADLRPRFVGSP